jgi:hypothetical protein
MGLLGRWAFRLGVAAAFLVVTSLAAEATVSVTVLSPPRTVSPGDIAIHVFAVVNEGPDPIEVALSAIVPNGWDHLGLPLSLSLFPGDEEAVFLTVVVPRIAAAGDHSVRLRAAWPTGEVSAAATIRVLAVAAVELVPPREGAGQPSESVTYDLSLLNRGNVLDRFSVDASSAHGWTVRVEPRELSLRPGERGAVRLVVSIPHHTEPGRDLLSVTVRSTEGAEARAAWFTTILPPGPEAIVGTVLSDLDMELGGRLGYDPIADRRMSLLALSGDGQVLEGDVDLTLHLTGPWDPAPYSVSRFSFAYDQGSAWVEAGEVGLVLSGLLLSLGADGMLAGLATESGTAALVTGWLGEEGRFGLRGAWLGTWGELGLAYRETRGEDHVRAGTLWVTGTLGDGLTLHGEGGIALSGPFLDAGFLVGLSAEAGTTLEFQADAYAVGPWFPSTRADRAGISLSGQLAVDPVGLRFVARWERDNVLGLPAVPVVVRSDLSTALDYAPAQWPVAFFAMAAVRRSLGVGPPALDRRARVLELAAVAGDSPLVLRLSGRWRKDEDLVAPSAQWTHEYDQRLTLSVGRTRAILTLTQAAIYDGLRSLVSAAEQVSLDLRTPAGVAFDFRHSRAGGSAGVEVPLSIPPAFTVTARVDMGWDPVGGVDSLYAVIAFEYAFSWTPPFLPARGWLEGTLFVDGNGNGRHDPEEEGVVGAMLLADGVRVSSGADGRFLFPPLSPGAYALTVDRLPPGFRVQTDLPLQVEVTLAGRTKVAIACERVGEISGAVYDDADQSRAREAGEPGLRGVAVILVQAGAEIGQVWTDPLGEFSFPDLPAGEYEVRLDVGSLPERYEPTTPEAVRVSLDPGAAVEVSFGAWQRPRPVVIVYRPPVADFAWSPPTPRAGEPITFDAAASLGEIVRYQWEFTGDDEPDAEGIVTTWTFPEPGFYLVALTVTDADGLEGQVELLIQVVP